MTNSYFHDENVRNFLIKNIASFTPTIFFTVGFYHSSNNSNCGFVPRDIQRNILKSFPNELKKLSFGRRSTKNFYMDYISVFEDLNKFRSENVAPHFHAVVSSSCDDLIVKNINKLCDSGFKNKCLFPLYRDIKTVFDDGQSLKKYIFKNFADESSFNDIVSYRNILNI